MKTMLSAIKCLLLGGLAVGAAAGCSRSNGLTYDDPESEVSYSIAWLKAQCSGASQLLTEDIVVKGRIVANDAYGEWSRSLVLADETGGITVYADDAELYARYPFGSTVVLYANGLRLYNYGGKVVIGSEPAEYGYGFGIPQEAIASHLYRGENPPDAPVPRDLSLADVAAEQIDTYVRITGVHFVEEGCWCDRNPETGRFVDSDRYVADEAGRTLRIRTQGNCTYAKEPLPSGKGTLCGVVDCFNGSYALRVVNREFDFQPAE